MAFLFGKELYVRWIRFISYPSGRNERQPSFLCSRIIR